MAVAWSKGSTGTSRALREALPEEDEAAGAGAGHLLLDLLLDFFAARIPQQPHRP